MKKIKEKLKLSKRQWEIGRIVVEELQNWESTTKAATEEMLRLIKRLSRYLTN